MKHDGTLDRRSDPIHALVLLGINAIVVFGAVFDHLTARDVVVLFWLEGLIQTFLVGILLVCHRARTRKRGHFLDAGAEASDASADTVSTAPHLPQYIGISVFLHLTFGVLLVGLIAMLGDIARDAEPWGFAHPAFRFALGWMVATLALGWCVDLITIRRRSMRWMTLRTIEVWSRHVLAALWILAGFAAVFLTFFWPVVTLIAILTMKIATELFNLAIGFLVRSRRPRLWITRLARFVPALRAMLDAPAWADFERQMRVAIEAGEEVLSVDEYRRRMGAPAVWMPGR